MTILFISDLHLDESQPKIADIFVHFLAEATKTAKALYILGDFFEAWIGDDDLSPFHLQIISALRTATSGGLSIYIMHGNRDFLLGKKFMRATGCTLLADECVVDIYGTPTLLMHGDTLCTADTTYLTYRKKVRRWLPQKLFLLKSLKSRRAIADKYRAASKKHVSTSAENIMDVTEDEVQRVMLAHGVSHMIHGHTHREALHQFMLNDKAATRTVLGAWHEEGRVLICHSDGRRELVGVSS